MEKLLDIDLGNDSLDMTPKAQAKTLKINVSLCTYIKLSHLTHCTYKIVYVSNTPIKLEESDKYYKPKLAELNKIKTCC